MSILKSDMEALQQKYGALNRNYESISNFALSDKVEQAKIK